MTEAGHLGRSLAECGPGCKVATATRPSPAARLSSTVGPLVSMAPLTNFTMLTYVPRVTKQ
jgi:hypothetical protein